jgi:methyl-accepting chemotaxis protein
MAGAWFARGSRLIAAEQEAAAELSTAKLRKSANAFTAFRDELVKRVRTVNDTTAQEVSEAGRYLSEVVESARAYVNDSQRALGRLQGQGQDSLGQLLGGQAQFLRNYAQEMADRAAAQDERARQAAAAAKSIGDLAASIDRLAGEARLLAVNARIESSRLGAQSAGFEVLATEMQRLSDEVASTNERVGELAGRLGQDLPWIAQHARDFRQAVDTFSATASVQLDDTERGVRALHMQTANASAAGGAVVESILRASRSALSHLQFQDVIAQELRRLDESARRAQVAALEAVGADSALLSEIPDAEYQTVGSELDPSSAAMSPSGDVLLF